jgi:sulfite reductase (NADPH) flavoprotein alpha-component
MVMIGPGTSIAPCRGFLHERRAVGARGEHWLLFGGQHNASDFLFKEEMETFRQEGLLTRLDTAFSRDQPDKIYAQHRMIEQAKELFDWIEHGAHVYVCGDASRTAKDVDTAHHEIIQSAGGKSASEAADYVMCLKSERRYQRDVY